MLFNAKSSSAGSLAPTGTIVLRRVNGSKGTKR